MFCSGQNALSKAIQASSYTLCGSQNTLSKAMQACYMLCSDQSALSVSLQASYRSNRTLQSYATLLHALRLSKCTLRNSASPSIATMLINCYRAPTDLYMDGNVTLSQEGITQGDPLAMPMYALATVPLIKRLTSTVKQTWYTDNAAATGKIANLRT